MKKKILSMLLAGFTGVIVLSGCSGKTVTVDEKTTRLNPGTYTGQSSKSDDEKAGGYTIVKLTIGEDNRITDVQLEIYDANGKNKFSEDYGKTYGEITDEEAYKTAQNAAKIAKQYAEQYMATQSLSEVDVITGATISYDQFIEASDIALHKASEQE